MNQRSERIGEAIEAVHDELFSTYGMYPPESTAQMVVKTVLKIVKPVPDPRIARIEARVSEWNEREETHYELIEDIRAILRGDA